MTAGRGWVGGEGRAEGEVGTMGGRGHQRYSDRGEEGRGEMELRVRMRVGVTVDYTRRENVGGPLSFMKWEFKKKGLLYPAV